jgi:hypothetical protein
VSKKKEKPVPEKKVVRLWQKQVAYQRTITGSEGEELEVVYPGRLNDTRGGDFRDAVVSAGKQLHFGCIEIHSQTSGWRTHGHQADPHYNQVVLHVALEDDTKGETVRQDGKVVPTVILNRAPLTGKGSNPNGHLSPCLAGKSKRKTGDILRLLEKAGMERFQLKAQRFSQEPADADEGQGLYLGVMEALGFSKNGRQFLELGRLFPLSKVEGMIRDGNRENSLRVLQAALLGTAGLLPSQRGLSSCEDRYVRELEGIWKAMPGKPVMSGGEWELFRVRPGNSPIRRIMALSYLILRFQPKGWNQSLEELALQVQSGQGFTVLESALMVKGGEYTAGQCDPGSFPNGCSDMALLGRERAREIIINVLLPYIRHRVESGRSNLSPDRVNELFCRYPRTESNSIERHMREQLGLTAGQVKTACLQQGMIHIYRQFCIRGKCRECRLAGSYY